MVNKSWSVEEEYTLLEFFSSHLDQYTKGVITKFYESALVALPLKSATQVKSKCIELESSYKTYKAKLSRSGFGVNATDPSSIKEMLSKKCKYFYEMDDIFGSRHNILPPIILEPGTTVRNGLMLPRQPADAACACTVATPVAARTLVSTNLPVPTSVMEEMTAVSSIYSIPAFTVQPVDITGSTPAVPSTTNSPTRPDTNLLFMPGLSPTPSVSNMLAMTLTPASSGATGTLLTSGSNRMSAEAVQIGQTPVSASEYFAPLETGTSVATENLSGNKRNYEELKGSPVAKLISRIRKERDETRAERHRDEMSLCREELALRQEQFQAYKMELKLKEREMERMFEMMTQKMELQAKKMEMELIKLRGSQNKSE
ncbi:hypothetical protein PF005_g2033 [Phytophthora fragariae]|uniref:Myb/SANT-like domain-containing protein n=1 Tax=Phytophthora fragariae TaxID=53985 RepID=A0A6A3TI01_9STRA|nr:hypothetical protein PF003_g2456 [Phytophthora fragariae]KAE8948264.1 hypothetical protein PF009_g2154 [Phytophthora fragariae]KAE9136767.1 hypothetical protein PF007_g2051 [Phytophthora fragariae]KAE9154316.1 hypothetical protein PF006_g1625 [Phytophthora fragariae]KAE9234092.1 hypothetical protein PF005_g2033 [Phytophthora fragariae]